MPIRDPKWSRPWDVQAEALNRFQRSILAAHGFSSSFPGGETVPSKKAGIWV
jgi:hypothetical protein